MKAHFFGTMEEFMAGEGIKDAEELTQWYRDYKIKTRAKRARGIALMEYRDKEVIIPLPPFDQMPPGTEEQVQQDELKAGKAGLTLMEYYTEVAIAKGFVTRSEIYG